ncbi:MAG: TolC family protein [Nitrospirae bacterium]|nr:TolC family protein [Nitrospirota bacterium]
MVCFLRLCGIFAFVTLVAVFEFVPPAFAVEHSAIEYSAVEYSLSGLFEIALKRSESIKISQEDVTIAHKGKDKAVSSFMPHFTASGSFVKFSGEKVTDTGFVIQPDTMATAKFKIEQSISLGGSEFISLDIAHDKITKGRLDLNTVKEDYLIGVATAYYDTLKAKKALTLAHSNVERLRDYKKAAEIKLHAGEVTKTAVLRAQAELSGAAAQLVSSENMLKIKKSTLARTVGLSGDFDIKDSVPAAFTELTGCPIAELDCFKQTAIEQRLEIKSARVQTEIYKKKADYAKSTYWPTLSVEGSYQRRDDVPRSTMVNYETLYGGVTLTFPVYEGGLRKAEFEEALAMKRQRDLALDDAIKSIGLEVESAYYNYISQKTVMASLNDQLVFSEDNFNAMRRQFDAGLATSLDVMDANNLLAQSEKQLADAVYSLELSAIKLRRSMGIFLKTLQGLDHAEN